MAPGRIHVYVGPTCPPDEILKRFPEVVINPPASHGDFFSPELRSGDVAVVIDGFYHHALGLRHKEYLHALDRGISVIGAASIGALRALELDSFGMWGCGVVYEQYRAGIFDGDDAVAVAHEADPPYTSLSVPLVNLHAAARAACVARVLREEQVDEVISVLRTEYYPARTQERVIQLLRQRDLPGFADWYAQRIADDPHVFDQKRQDCFSALEAARGIAAAGARGHVRGGENERWKTFFVRHWRNHFVGLAGDPPLRHRLAYQQIFDPHYERVWVTYLNETYARRGRPFFGDVPPDLADFVAGRTGTDRFLPAGGPEHRDWLFDVLCPEPDLADPREVELLLAGEEPADVEAVSVHLRQTLAFAGASGAEQRLPTLLSRDAGKLLLSRVWEIPVEQLARECRRRGIPNIKTAMRLLQPFIVGVLKTGKYWRMEAA